MPDFRYTDEETAYLAERDPKLGSAIVRIGYIEREIIPDLFEALVHSIIGQQISSKAQASIWARMKESLKPLNPSLIMKMDPEEMRNFGISLRKANYIHSAARKIVSGELDIGALAHLSDKEVIEKLCSLDGVGRWTAEMLMIFSMQRSDILSFGDFGIRKGLRMLYGHPNIDRALFEFYRQRYSPCGTVASFYLWAIAGGAIPEWTDPAVK